MYIYIHTYPILPSSVARDGTYQFCEGTIGALRQTLDQRIHLVGSNQESRWLNEDPWKNGDLMVISWWFNCDLMA